MPRKPRKKKETLPTSEVLPKDVAISEEETKENLEKLLKPTLKPTQENQLCSLKAEINAILDTAPTMPINITVRDREEKFRPAYKEFLAKLRQAVK